MAAPLDYSNCNSLQDCFEVRLQHCRIHNKHEEIRDQILVEYAKGCKVVKELGVWQGGTFGMFLTLDGVEEIVGVDISFNKYNNCIKKFVDEYAEQNNKTVTLLETSSISIESVSECDFMHIDSLHHPDHLHKELMLHANSVSKRIAFHDVNQNGRQLYKVIENFITNVQPMKWFVVKDYALGKCGCTVIERIGSS